jgi:hypothetical protein
MLTASIIWKLFAAPDWTSCNARIWTIITLHKTNAAMNASYRNARGLFALRYNENPLP